MQQWQLNAFLNASETLPVNHRPALIVQATGEMSRRR
jgi:hypothetical protein